MATNRATNAVSTPKVHRVDAFWLPENEKTSRKVTCKLCGVKVVNAGGTIY